jgi:phosphatidylinositol kinase/protein kinase (PI-3  family)
MNSLLTVTTAVKNTPVSKRTQVLTSELLKVELPTTFFLPLNPSIQFCGIQVDKCRWLDSASCPLWLVFQNADSYAKPVPVLFKSGDDLRQDMLTLQMLKIMDHLWKDEGLDLHVTCYDCIATGENSGLIEIVLNSKSTAEIQKAHGGGVTSAFKKTPLASWLKQNNRTPELYQQAVENFSLSSAAYSVLTFVLGISDRHNDNVMLTTDGHLFHIDFG